MIVVSVFTASATLALVYVVMRKMVLGSLEAARHPLLSVELAIVGEVFTALVKPGLLSRGIAQVASVYGDRRIVLRPQVENFTIMGGDLIRAGAGTVFRVLNNGDVLVRGQKIGAQGPKGAPGAPGPAVRTVALCANSSGLGNPTCPCENRTVTRQGGLYCYVGYRLMLRGN